MASIPPVPQPTPPSSEAGSPSTPPQAEMPLKFQGEKVKAISGQALVHDCQQLHGAPRSLAGNIVQAESTLARVEHSIKETSVAASFIDLGLDQINLATEHAIDPLSLIQSAGVHIDSRLELVAEKFEHAELLLKGIKGAISGTHLILRNQYLQNATEFISYLKLKKELLTGENKVKIEAYIINIEEKILQEKEKLAADIKSYGLENGLNLLSVVGTAMRLADKATPVASLTLGWIGGVTGIGLAIYQLHKANKAFALHSEWLAHKHQKHAPDNTAQRERACAVVELRDSKAHIIGELRDLTIKKHEVVNEQLHFLVSKKKLAVFLFSLLGIAILVLKVVAITVALGMIILAPQFALLGASVALLAVGATYWATNRPNLFKAYLLTFFHSTYYSIGKEICAWKVQRKMVSMIDCSSKLLDLTARNRLPGSKVDPQEIQTCKAEHDLLRGELETLEKDMAYWTAKKRGIHTRLLDAELADINRLHKQAGPNLGALVEDFAKELQFLTPQDKKKLHEEIGLDLTDLEQPSRKDILERLLRSHLGISEDEMVSQLQKSQE